MRKFLIGILSLSLLGCAQKEGKVVYIPEERDNTVKVEEYCTTDGIDEICIKEIYKRVYVEKKSEYEKEKEKLLLKLLQNPPTPVKTPDRILMIYVLPWVDKDGNFHAGQYVFVKVEEGQWIFEKSKRKTEKIKLLTPLEDRK